METVWHKYVIFRKILIIYEKYCYEWHFHVLSHIFSTHLNPYFRRVLMGGFLTCHSVALHLVMCKKISLPIFFLPLNALEFFDTHYFAFNLFIKINSCMKIHIYISVILSVSLILRHKCIALKKTKI